MLMFNSRNGSGFKFALTIRRPLVMLSLTPALLVGGPAVVGGIGSASADVIESIAVEQAVRDYVDATNAVDLARLRNDTCGYMAEELETLGPLVAYKMWSDGPARGSRLIVNGFGETRIDGDAATAAVTLSRTNSPTVQSVEFRLARSEGAWKVCSTDSPIA
ncbi:hypothetical protein AB0N05_17705 [Nocardia sp. NPDC051030]|uniref:Rv0361 family membrane protein n=1 Tax=Nocardia sp. NPDC051030 TaxID=3155162 RepID=UPI0034434C0D